MLTQKQSAQLPCNLQIDYSQVTGGNKILPFLIELNLETSILDPAPGQNQRFCYNITGIGADSSSYTDLSHIVFGICSQIVAAQIVNIFVSIDGVKQVIDFGSGGNVELRTSTAPDPPTGCPGLKFNFGLNKVNGIMIICYELTTPYTVGPNPVCLFGGNTTATGLSICGPFCAPPETCTSNGYQSITACAPVTVTPFARTMSTTTHCCGDPVVSTNTSTCAGTINGSCRFTLSQNLCIEVPVEFGVTASVGSPAVQCDTASSEDICADCTEDNGAADGQAAPSAKAAQSVQTACTTYRNAKSKWFYF